MIEIRPGVRYALLATFFFSIMQISVKAVHLPAEEIVFFRAIISLVICMVMIRRKGIPMFGNNKKWLILRGLFGAIALYLFFYTLQNMPLATAVTLQYLSPIFTVLFAMFLLNEKASGKQWLAFMLALGGVLLVKGFDPQVSIMNMVIGIVSAMFSGLAYNSIRKLKDSDDPLVVVLYFPLLTIPVITPMLLANWVWPQGWDWALLVFIGVCTQIAQVYMTKAYQSEKAADITIFKYTGIIYAISFGYLLFGEIPALLSVVGMAIVVLGVYLGSIAKRPKRHIGPAPGTEG